MADLNNLLTSANYSALITEIKELIMAQMKLDPQGIANIPVGTMRLNPSTKIFEKFNGTSWDTLTLAEIESLQTSVANNTQNISNNILAIAEKEPSFSKNSGFNLNKTDSYNTDNTNLVATAKAIKDGLSTKENIIGTKGTAFNKNFGTTSGTVAEGNHSHSGDVVGCAVYRGDDVQIIAGNNYNAMIMDQVEFNTNSCYDTTTGLFTAPETGIYLISIKIVANTRFGLGVFKNPIVSNGGFYYSTSRLYDADADYTQDRDANTKIKSWTGIVSLAQGDTIGCGAYQAITMKGTLSNRQRSRFQAVKL